MCARRAPAHSPRVCRERTEDRAERECLWCGLRGGEAGVGFNAHDNTIRNEACEYDKAAAIWYHILTLPRHTRAPGVPECETGRVHTIMYLFTHSFIACTLRSAHQREHPCPPTAATSVAHSQGPYRPSRAWLPDGRSDHRQIG